MRSLIAAVSIATMSAAACGPALAQPFIEIGWDGTGLSKAGGGIDERFGGRVVFDAAAAPESASDSVVQFVDVVAERLDEDGHDHPLITTPYQTVNGSLSYYFGVGFDYLLIFAGSDYLKIDSPAFGFGPGMGSLPDDPAAYAFAGGDTEYVITNGWRWSPDDGFEDCSFRYWIRVVDDPSPPEPCIADADGNGILDLTDVNLFAATFVAGCP